MNLYAEPMLGTVTDFDDPRGLGTITATDGTTYPFHCTQLVDGTRTIDVATPVWFRVVAGHLGRFEATAVTRSAAADGNTPA